MGGLASFSDQLPIGAASGDLDWATHTKMLRAQLERAQDRFKKQADRHRTERIFDVGGQVLLKL